MGESNLSSEMVSKDNNVEAGTGSAEQADMDSDNQGVNEHSLEQCLDDGNEQSPDAGQQERENERLDAIDAMPENRRRAGIILTIMGILAVIAIITVIALPPLSWQPQKTVKSNFHAVSAIENVAPGANAELNVSYRTITEERVSYGLNLEQVSEYENGAVSRVTVSAIIDLMRPGRREAEDEVIILLRDVNARVFDGDKEVTLASAGAMLAGISLYSRLNASDGLISIVPDANINPQVARVLFVISDAMRQIWQPLPKEKIGVGSRWTLKDIEYEKTEFLRTGNVVVDKLEQGIIGIASEITLQKRGKNGELQMIGSGKVRSALENGFIKDGEFEYVRSEESMAGGARTQRLKAAIARKSSDE